LGLYPQRNWVAPTAAVAMAQVLIVSSLLGVLKTRCVQSSKEKYSQRLLCAKFLVSKTEAKPRVNIFFLLTSSKDKKQYALAAFFFLATISFFSPSTIFADSYEGERNDDGLFHGRGSYVSDSGWEYSGQWLRGQKNGNGTQVWTNGDKYSGEWLDGMPNGKGSMTFSNGEQYVGEFVSGRMSGKGIFTYLQNARYAGSWLDDVPHGKGVMTFSNGDEYRGELVQGERSGTGLMKYNSGDVYNGAWQGDVRSGLGSMTYANGDQYEGNWSNGKKHGKGVYVHANGNEYDGEWRADRQHGKGRLSYRDGSSYDGQWRKNYKHGLGKFTNAAGGFYDGEWRNGLRHGKGLLVEADGRAFSGTFELNVPKGLGMCGMISNHSVRSTSAVVIENQSTCEYQALHQARPVAETATGRPSAASAQGSNYASVASVGTSSATASSVRTLVEKLYFEHDFHQGGIYDSADVSWWKQEKSLRRSTLGIVSSDSVMNVVISIPKYKGPGSYSLGDRTAYLTIRGSNSRYEVRTKNPGSITVVKEQGRLLTGYFSFTAYNEKQETVTVNKGDFSIRRRKVR